MSVPHERLEHNDDHDRDRVRHSHRDYTMRSPLARRSSLHTNRGVRRTSVTLAIVGALATVGCGGESDAKEAEASAAPARAPIVLAAQDVAVAREADIGSSLTISGPLQPKESVTLRAQVAGTISELTVDRGNAVRRGQRVATIRAAGVVSQAAGARANVTAAEANLAVAREEMEAARTLHEAGAISERERQTAEARHAAALAQLEAAKAQSTSAVEAAGYTTITSPINGVVSARQRQRGENVSVGDEVLTVVNGRVLELSGQIGVGDASRVRVGQEVSFTLDAFPGEPFRGRVARMDPVADPGTRQVGVYVELANPAGRIVGGQYARGRIALGVSRAIVVPFAAVRGAAADGTGGHVFVVRDGKIERREVTLGARDEAEGTVAVTSGVQAGEQVIVTPSTDVTEGAP